MTPRRSVRDATPPVSPARNARNARNAASAATTDAAVADADRPISELKAELFRALAHPGRIRILERLVEGERSVGELQPLVGLELSHLSQQLGVLRRADLVTARKEGASVFYSVRDPLLDDVLATARQLLMSSLTESQRLLSDLHRGPSS